jgi:hypothetical protein
MSLINHRSEGKNILLSGDCNNWTSDPANSNWLFRRKKNGRDQKIEFEVPAGRYEYKRSDAGTNLSFESN